MYVIGICIVLSCCISMALCCCAVVLGQSCNISYIIGIYLKNRFNSVYIYFASMYCQSRQINGNKTGIFVFG